MRGWTKILLGLSLTLNLFVIGAVAGVLILRQQILSHAIAGDPLMSAAAALSPARRDAFKALLSEKLQSVRPGLRDARMARRQAMAIMRSEPFDRAGASADLARARADDVAARETVEEAFLDFSAHLAPSERTALAKGLARSAVIRWMASHPGRRPPGPSDP